jgi:putative redox protein
MGEIEVRWAAGDRFLIGVRGHDLVVDQPKDAGGDDVGPTPTELFVASLAACVGFYAERFLKRHGLPIEGLRVQATFAMSEDRPARVTSIDLSVGLPVGFPAARRAALAAVIGHCTVHNSIRLEPEVSMSFVEREVVAA